MTTVGVEEEYLLLNPATGMPVPRVEEVRAAAGLHPALGEGEVQRELLRAQVEVSTPACETLGEIGGHLLRLRYELASAAEAVGCRLAACGAAALAPASPVPVTDTPRYRALHRDAPQLVDEQLICGMHVHVAVPDPEAGVAVLNRLRPWLPMLVAMSANSPLWRGDDTGFASWRTVVFGRWPVSGPPPHFANAADYRRRVEDLVGGGLVRDHGQVYWQARLSERYPTLEVRAMDVQLGADDAVMLAGIVRGLVETALEAERAGEPVPEPRPELLAGATWHAARHGLDDILIDPVTAKRRKAGEAVAALMEHITPALERSGDAREVHGLVHRLLQQGTAADQQRRAWHEHGPDALLRFLVTRTAAGRDTEN